MLDVLAAVFSGGFLGFLGTVFKGIMAYKQEKLEAEERAKDRRFELDKMNADREYMLAEAEAQMQRIEVETEGELAVATLDAEREARAQSYQHDSAKYAGEKIRGESKLMLFVDFCRGMVRPVLTAYVVILTSAVCGAILYGLWVERESIEFALSTSNHNPAGLGIVHMLLDNLKNMILLICNLTTLVVTWWFGDRNSVGQKLVEHYGKKERT